MDIGAVALIGAGELVSFSTLRPSRYVLVKAIFQGTFAIVVVTAIAVTAVWALVKFVGLEASLVWTALMGAIGWAVQTNVARKHEYQRLLADKKREQYDAFLSFLNQIMPVQGAETKDLSNSPEVVSQLRLWSLRLTLIGSDDVIKKWNALRLEDALTVSGATAGLSVLRQWGELWLAMRKDAGHASTALKPSDLLASFVNDVDKHRSVLDGVETSKE